MQLSNAAEQLTEPSEETEFPSAPARREPKLFESERFQANPSITGTWARPVIVLNNEPFHPFRVR